MAPRTLGGMKTFRFRGVDRIVGACTPDPERVAALHRQPWFHELVRVRESNAVNAAPIAPPSVDYWTAAAAALDTMLANGPDPSAPPQIADTGVGDCVNAADQHGAAERACNAGAPCVPTCADALAEYAADAGFDINNVQSSDQGTDPTAMIAWRLGPPAQPYPDGSVLVAAPPVCASNVEALQQAVWLAVGCLGWLSMPDGCESEEDAGDTWDVCGPPNPQNGHGVWIVDYDATKGFRICTWGEMIWATPAFMARYFVPSAGGGCVAMIDGNCINRLTGLAPSGLDLSTLQAYLQGLQQPPQTPATGNSTLGRIVAEARALAAALGRDADAVEAQLLKLFRVP